MIGVTVGGSTDEDGENGIAIAIISGGNARWQHMPYWFAERLARQILDLCPKGSGIPHLIRGPEYGPYVDART